MSESDTSSDGKATRSGLARRASRLALVVAVNLLLFALLVLALELLASLWVSKPGSNVVANWRLNHTWKPGGSQTHSEWGRANPEFPEPYTHHYNRQGWLEDYDVRNEKPESTWRIFYVGDSFIEGTCPMDQSVPSIVERELNALAEGKGWKVEVVNTGTTSYSPTLYYLLVRYVLMDYSPDLIVVNVDMTDDFDDWKYSQTLIRDDEGNPLFAPPRSLYESAFLDTEGGPVKTTLWTKAQLFLAQHSYAYNLSRRWFKRKRQPGRPAPHGAGQGLYPRWAWCRHEWDGLTEKNVEYSLDLLRRLAAWCRSHHVKFMLTGVPHYWQYSGNFDGGGTPLWSSRPHRELAGLARDAGIAYLNSFERLASAVRGTPQMKYYYYRDMHFNPRGYALWAKAHVEFLVDRTNALLPEDLLAP